MTAADVFHFRGKDVLAPGDDHVRLAVDEEEVALLVLDGKDLVCPISRFAVIAPKQNG